MAAETTTSSYLMAIAVNGFATGTGVVFANWIFEKMIRPRLNKAHKVLAKRINGKRKKRKSEEDELDL